MGRPRSLANIKDYSRALKNGRGLGVGSDYLPWLRVNDVPSRGKSTKIYGIKTERTYQLLSGVESNFFTIAEYNPRVVDIREQFPLLPLDLIVRVANEAGINYPIISKSNDPCVLTTDFVLTISDKDKITYLPVAAKTSEELNEPGVAERLEIERLWWSAVGAPWRLVTEKQIKKVVARNIEWFAAPLRGRKQLLLRDNCKEEMERLAGVVVPGIYEWSGLVNQLSHDIKLSTDKTLVLLKAAIWHQLILVNMDTRIEIARENVIEILDINDKIMEERTNAKISS